MRNQMLSFFYWTLATSTSDDLLTWSDCVVHVAYTFNVEKILQKVLKINSKMSQFSIKNIQQFFKSNQFNQLHKSHMTSLKYDYRISLWNEAAKLPINFIYLYKHFQYLYKRPDICRITCCFTLTPSILKLLWLIALVVADFLIRLWWMEIFSFWLNVETFFIIINSRIFSIHEYIEMIFTERRILFIQKIFFYYYSKNKGSTSYRLSLVE